MTKTTMGKLVKYTAVGIDVTVPLVATLTQFPVWIQASSEATVSGLFLFFALLSCIPFLKQIKEYFKSPSAWVIWLIMFVAFATLQSIIQQMIIIAFAGLVANLLGMVIYKVGERLEKADKTE
jgi:L-lactate permease